MTPYQRRKQTEWRRCIYCGKYMSYKDLEKGQAHNFTSITALEPADDCFSHRACHEAQKEKVR